MVNMNTIDVMINKQTQFRTLVARIIKLPIWVKQAIYCELKADMTSCSDVELLDRMESKIIQLYVPKLTLLSTRLIESNALHSAENINENQKNFILAANEGLNMLEIAHENNISFKYACELYTGLVQQSYLEDLNNNQTKNFVLYIMGKIRLGEFLVRTGRINTAQLDKCLFTKKCSESFDSDISFKEILVNLGYIEHKEVDSISLIKNSSEISVSVIDESEAQSNQIEAMQYELDTLMYQRKQLQEKLDFYKREVELKNHENLEQAKQIEKYSKGFVGRFLGTLS